MKRKYIFSFEKIIFFLTKYFSEKHLLFFQQPPYFGKKKACIDGLRFVGIFATTIEPNICIKKVGYFDRIFCGYICHHNKNSNN